MVKTGLRFVKERQRAGRNGCVLLTPTGSRTTTTRTRTIEDAGWKPDFLIPPAPIIGRPASGIAFRGGGYCVPIVVVLRPYSRSEVIHRAGDESLFPAFERERPRIVNNFAASASSGYEFSSISEKMNERDFGTWRWCLGRGTNTQMRTNRLLRRLRLAIRNSHPARAARRHYPLLEYERIRLRATA